MVNPTMHSSVENIDVINVRLTHKTADVPLLEAEEAKPAIEVSINQDALRHILRIASGLESMVVGEDQVLNQLWDAFLEAETEKTVGPGLRHVFNKAASVGSRARNETRITTG